VYAQIKAKEFYGYRKTRQRGIPLTKIETIEQLRHGKWKVRFVEGQMAGDVEIVTSAAILVHWTDASAFLQDEERMLKLLHVCESQWSGNPDDPVMDAVNLVFESTGEKDATLESLGHDMGHGHMHPETAKRILARAGLSTEVAELDPFSFVDREGELHLSFAASVKIAQAFATAEPDTVIITADANQQKWESELTEPHQVGLLQNWRAGWTLARQWAHGGAVITNRSLLEMRHNIQNGWDDLWKRFADIEQGGLEETQRLRNLLVEAAELLRTKGAEKEADRILLKLYQPSKGRVKGSDRST
jgi:hypothetical protein